MSIHITENQLIDLRHLLSAEQVTTDPQDLETYGRDWTHFFPPSPSAIVFPRSVEEVQSLVLWANQQQVSLVPSGGRTGLSGGACATQGEVVVSLSKMNKILDINPVDQIITCEAGVITEQLAQFAQEHSLFFPVSFASQGSSCIGGNIATNAGGVKVLRYGGMRDYVVGLTVVTGKGDILRLNHGLVKNATGYDLRHLMVGSEGTLGIVVEAMIKCIAPPKPWHVMVLGIPDLQCSMPLLTAFRQSLTITAFEFFSEEALQHVIAKGQQRPFASISPYYVLVEFESSDDSEFDTALQAFEHGMEQGWIEDGVVSQSESQATALWQLREGISESIAEFTPYKDDIAVRPSAVPEFLARVDGLMQSVCPDFQLIRFGHIGDGNMHLNILKPEDLPADQFKQQCDEITKQVFALIQEFSGSISAEHGVGLLKKPFLNYARSSEEIALSKAMKQLFDPNNILNPGKIY